MPNEGGRVTGLSGTYVAGWIERDPTGFIGTNKSCGADGARARRRLQRRLARRPVQQAGRLDQLIQPARPAVVDAAGWQAIDSAEIARGGDTARANKFTAIGDMLAAAAAAPAPPIRKRLLAGLRR